MNNRATAEAAIKEMLGFDNLEVNIDAMLGFSPVGHTSQTTVIERKVASTRKIPSNYRGVPFKTPEKVDRYLEILELQRALTGIMRMPMTSQMNNNIATAQRCQAKGRVGSYMDAKWVASTQEEWDRKQLELLEGGFIGESTHPVPELMLSYERHPYVEAGPGDSTGTVTHSDRFGRNLFCITVGVPPLFLNPLLEDSDIFDEEWKQCFAVHSVLTVECADMVALLVRMTPTNVAYDTHAGVRNILVPTHGDKIHYSFLENALVDQRINWTVMRLQCRW
jgi:hypothetical protein